ncbi:MAG: hypothetical protein GXP25_09670 [Planctomycetes bacterium]|nr:hypothetical protein [Planctomycetota bacterium]
MRKRLGLMAAAIALAIGTTLAQDAPPQGECQKKPEAKTKGRAMRMMGAFSTFRALRSVAGELTEEQKTKLGEAREKMTEKMKKVCEEFEADLGGVLTAEQMEKYKKAKEAGPGGRRGRNPAHMAQMMEVGKTFRALGSIEGELSEEQKAKLNEVRERIVKKMQEDLETELGNILTANQMEKYKKARESTPQFGMMRHSRGQRGGRGPTQE